MTGCCCLPCCCVKFHPDHHRHLHAFRFLQSHSRHHSYLPCFRSFALLINLQTLLGIFLESSKPAYLLAFFTIWGALSASLTFLLLLLLSCHCWKTKSSHQCLLKLTQVIYTIALSIAIPIFLIFWLILFPMALQVDFFKTHSLFFQIQLHLFIQTLLVLDFILSGVRFITSHICFVLFTALFYIVINAIVTLKVFVVYPIMTWKDPMTAIWIILALVLGIGAFLFFLWLGSKKKIDSQQRHAAIIVEQEDPDEKAHEMIDYPDSVQ